MNIKISETQIIVVQKKHPDSHAIPAHAAKVTSFYRKGEKQPWFKPVKDWNPAEDQLVCGDFVSHHQLEFTSKKGTTPEGIKTYYLTEGIYMGKIFADADDDRGRIVFYAVTDTGKLTEISGNQASDLAAEANGKVFQHSPKSESRDDNSQGDDGEGEESQSE